MKKNSNAVIILLTIALVCLLSISTTFAAISASNLQSQSIVLLKSGLYVSGSAKVGIDSNRMTVSVDETDGENGRFTCRFYFDGIITKPAFAVYCRNDLDTGIVEGKVEIHNDTSFFLKTKSNPGCSDMIANIENDGLLFKLEAAKPCLQIRLVKEEKAFFYTEPQIATKRKAYLVKNNEALVSEKKPNWLKVTFGKTTGWMQESDMYPLTK